MNALMPLVALNMGDIIQILVIILLLVIPALGQILAKMREPQRPGGPQRAPGQAPPQQPAQRPKSVKDEIEAFLRRTLEQKGVAAPQPPRQVVAPPPPPSMFKESVKAQVVRERPVGGEVTEHVRKYLDEKEFAQRASSLGGEVAQADDKIEQHLRNVFEHKIGQLAGRPGETAAAPAPLRTGFFEDEVPAVSAAAGVGLAALLNNIDNLRQAIVLNEILQRPIDRW